MSVSLALAAIQAAGGKAGMLTTYIESRRTGARSARMALFGHRSDEAMLPAPEW